MKLYYYKLHYLLLLALFHTALAAADIYKYQDQNGKWHYSDKKPAIPIRTIESLKTKIQKAQKRTPPFLETKQANGKIHYIAHNPLLAPVQCILMDKETKKKVSMKTLPPTSSATLFKQQNSLLKRQISFHYILGDPETKPSPKSFFPPFSAYKPMQVSQGFNGKFSHTGVANRYAVDISMPVGTKITAVRDGTVIRTKDDYALAGISSPFFLDKANLVEILHDDGTFALYGHLLLGGVQVNEGDRVSAGDIIGLSGNTGYSSGPHLHFVIRYNDNGKMRSLPFKLLQPNNKLITPKKGDWILPYSSN